MEKNSLVDQLQKHIDEIGEEAFQKETFEFNCKWYGIDPNSKNAQKKLKRKQWWEKFRYRQLPKIKIGLDFVITILSAFCLGAHIMNNDLWGIGLCSGLMGFFGTQTFINLFRNENF